MAWQPEDTEKDLEQASEALQMWIDALPQYLEGKTPGTRRLGVVERQGMLASMLKQYPPEPFVNEETGEVVLISPWALAMQVSEGGMHDLEELANAFKPRQGGR